MKTTEAVAREWLRKKGEWPSTSSLAALLEAREREAYLRGWSEARETAVLAYINARYPLAYGIGVEINRQTDPIAKIISALASPEQV